MRPLSPIEEAFTLTNRAYPLTVVAVLRLVKPPPVERLQEAMNRLQQTHAFLRVSIVPLKKGFAFREIPDCPPVRIECFPAGQDTTWLQLATRAVNTRLEEEHAPLLRCWYEQQEERAELLVLAHHAIADATHLSLLLHQLLQMSCLEGDTPLSGSPSPRLRDALPGRFRGLSLLARLIPFVGRQWRLENNRRSVLSWPVTRIATNSLYTLHFSADDTRDLVRFCRRNRISLFQYVNAAMLQVLYRERATGSDCRMRAVQFANLRPYLQPAPGAEAGGSFTALMRLQIPVQRGSTLVETARQLHTEATRAGRHGDKFLFALLSPLLVSQAIRTHKARLADTALSYAGAIPLREQYGSTMVDDVHAFITNNGLGPPFSAFARLWKQELALDMIFLEAETPATLADQRIRRFRECLFEPLPTNEH